MDTTLKERVEETLEQNGLSKKEAAVYLALLELGETSAARVTRATKLRQSTVYLILNMLVEKGFARHTPRKRKRLFIAEDPSVLGGQARRRAERFERIVPELEALARTGGEKKVRTMLYEGLAGIRSALWYRIKDTSHKKYTAFYGRIDEKTPSELTSTFLQWNETMAKQGTTVRAIAPEDPSLSSFRSTDEQDKREVRLIPREKYDSSLSIEAHDDFVRIVMMKELQALIIESPEVARSLRHIFELVWEKTPTQGS